MYTNLTPTYVKQRLSRSFTIIICFFILFSSLPINTLAQKKTPRTSQANNSQNKYEMPEQQRLVHLLSRIGFGARLGDIERVRALGISAYIDTQLDPDSIDDSVVNEKLAKLATLVLPTPSILERFNPPPPAQPKPEANKPESKAVTPAKTEAPKMDASNPEMAKTDIAKIQMVKGQEPNKPNQEKPKETPKTEAPKPPPNPQQVITELQRATFLRAAYSNRQLYELMVNFWENHFNIFINKDSDRFLLTSFDRDAIRPFALGKFRDLLGATAHSPAMLYYLDNWQSKAPRVIPASKERAEQIISGLNENYARELMELHTLGVDGGYSQKDVQEVARCFTGWTIRKPNEEGLFLYNPTMHDNGEKIVLGQRIAVGGGIKDAETVLDILARHPSTARFIATKLARRFISDDPPIELINRASAVFLKTDGSIKETVKAILMSPEFFSLKAYRAKIKSPFEYAVSAVRVLEAETDGDKPMLDWIARMGEPIFGKLTPNGYADKAEEWLSATTIIERLNFSTSLVNNEIKGTKVDTKVLLAGLEVKQPETAVNWVVELLLNGKAEPKTLEALNKAALDTPQNAQPNNQSKAPSSPLIALVIGAPDFQKR